MPTLVYQCPSGISGDMNLGAMIALGVDTNRLIAELRKLPYDGWSLDWHTDKRGGISGTRCSVSLTEHTHPHRHDHGHDHHHPDPHTHTDNHHHHHGDHRTFEEIRNAIEQSEISPKAKTYAINCFRVLAEAEGAVHGIPAEKVHFHEVGAIDSIIDIVGAAICWDLLQIDRIVCTTLEVGGGTVQCAHGRMPVPAPATARLLEGKNYTSGATDKETTTPTGAALLIGMGTEFKARTDGRLIKTAIGIGQRNDPNLANVLYATLIDESLRSEEDTTWELATNLDDMSPEAIGFLCQQLREAGALEVWQNSAFYKKDRIGTIVTALVQDTEVKEIESIFFKHSTTLGIRRREWSRTILERETKSIQTPWGEVRLKIATLPDGSTRQKYEYDDLARIANTEKQTLDWVKDQITKILAQDLN